MSLDCLNARVRSRKGTLIGGSGYETLFSNFSMSHLIEYLLGTHYSTDLKKYLKAGDELQAVLRAVGDYTENEIRGILSMADGYTKTLTRVFLLRWDLVNLKAIFVSKISGSTEESFSSTGVISQHHCMAIAKSTFSEAARILSKYRMPFLDTVCGLVKTLENSGDAEKFCTSLDMAYYRRMTLGDIRPPDAELLNRIMAPELDRRNVMEVLQAVTEGRRAQWKPPGHYGKVGPGTLRSMAALNSVDKALEVLLNSPYEKEILDGSLLFGLTGELNYIERLLEARFLRALSMEAMINPLDRGVAMSYLALRINEVVNLSMVALGLRFGMVANMIRRKMIIP